MLEAGAELSLLPAAYRAGRATLHNKQAPKDPRLEEQEVFLSCP